MRVIFRTDASIQIGTGHVVRCLALAGELRRRGADVEFVCRDMEGGLADVVAAEGYPVHRLAATTTITDAEGPIHATSLGASMAEDAEATRRVVAERAQPDWLVVDHYALDARWESALRGAVRRIAVIDDLADRRHDCDLLIDQNLGAEETGYERLVGNDCRLLLGPIFALLRPDFAMARAQCRHRDGKLRRLLVSFGGGDSAGLTLTALEAIERLDSMGLSVDVVAGRHNPHLAEIERRISNIPRACLHVQTQRMAELMSNADLMLGAAGSTTWERCCVGLPGVAICTAENQVHPALRMATGGFSLHLGWFDDISASTMEGALRTLSASPWLLQFMSENCGRLVDGMGTTRVADRMQRQDVALRRARPDDCVRMFEWRNASEVRRYSFDPLPLDLEAHRQWFDKTLATSNRVLLIGECDGQDVGVIRFDLSGDRAIVSVYLVPGWYGHGYGTSLISAGSRWVRENVGSIARIVAEVKVDNPASCRAFEAAGFKRYAHVYVEEFADAPSH